jgi:hypothetical protein
LMSWGYQRFRQLCFGAKPILGSSDRRAKDPHKAALAPAKRGRLLSRLPSVS